MVWVLGLGFRVYGTLRHPFEDERSESPSSGPQLPGGLDFPREPKRTPQLRIYLPEIIILIKAPII